MDIFLDHYVHDIDDRIKYAAISKQPELMIELMTNPTDDELRFACNYLYDQWSPDVEHLKAYLDAAHVDDPKDHDVGPVVHRQPPSMGKKL